MLKNALKYSLWVWMGTTFVRTAYRLFVWPDFTIWSMRIILDWAVDYMFYFLIALLFEWVYCLVSQKLSKKK